VTNFSKEDFDFMAAIAFLIWAALDREQETGLENPTPTIGAPQSNRPGFQDSRSTYDDKGNYIQPGYEIER
jgi:hypothetical protein